MKRCCLALALVLVLLCGCRADTRPVSVVSTGTAASVAASKQPTASLSATTALTTAVSAGTASAETTTSRVARTTTRAATTAAPSTTRTTEMRGVWLSYYEIDALLNGKTAAAAGAALDELMQTCASYGLNTVFFHVRGNSDAYYASQQYPAATSVKSLLVAGFDPLQRAVQAAHKNGLKLHAWVNPYRVGKDKTRARVDKIFTYQDTLYYMPHEAAVQQLVVAGVREIVQNYAVDGVQFDDYFYPEGGVPTDQPAAFEKTAFSAWQQKNSSGTIGNWRRSCVDALIRDVYKAVHTRAGCVFGVSPDADADKDHDRLYADVTGWMNRADRLDYVCPQVYYGFEHETRPFHKMVQQWRGYKRRSSVQLYVGLALYKAGQADAYAGSGADEWQTHDSIMARSVNWLRTRKDCGGFAFFSYAYFTPASAGLTGKARQIAAREVEQVLALMR